MFFTPLLSFERKKGYKYLFLAGHAQLDLMWSHTVNPHSLLSNLFILHQPLPLTPFKFNYNQNYLTLTENIFILSITSCFAARLHLKPATLTNTKNSIEFNVNVFILPKIYKIIVSYYSKNHCNLLRLDNDEKIVSSLTLDYS